MSDHEYRFDKDISTENYEIKISNADAYGYFEHNELGDECGGGLWFDGYELVDYDGVFELPDEVVAALRKHDYFGDAIDESGVTNCVSWME